MNNSLLVVVIASGVAADVRSTRTGTSSDSDIIMLTSNYDLTQVQGGGFVTAAMRAKARMLRQASSAVLQWRGR